MRCGSSCSGTSSLPRRRWTPSSGPPRMWRSSERGRRPSNRSCAQSTERDRYVRDMRVALPALWVFMVLNYLYCDVLSLFDPAIIKDLAAGHAAGGSVSMTPEFLFASAMLMEIPMAMILLSRVLGHRASRWANIVAAAFMAVVQLGSLVVGTPAAYYLFFSAIEVSTLVLIGVLALRWAD